MELHMHPVVLCVHRHHLAFAACDHVNYFRRIFFGDINSKQLYRLTFHAVDLTDDHLRLSDLQLIALTTHGLDKHRQVQHAAAEHGPHILIARFLNTERQISVKLTGETVADMA